MSNIDRLELFRNLRKTCPFEDSGTSIDFEIEFLSDQDKLKIQDIIDQGLIDDSFKIDSAFKSLEELNSHFYGKKLVASSQINDWRNKGLFVFRDFEEFLKYLPNRESVPEAFYIIDCDLLFPKDEPTGKIKHYIEVVTFLNHLKNCADYAEKASGSITNKLVFLHKSKFEISINYDLSILSEGLDGLSVIESLLQDNSHKDQKISILKEVLYEMLINQQTDKRLSYLIAHFGEFSKRFNENYQLFVSNFSFDKVRREFEEKKREYLTKINATFSELAAKLLSIPITFFLAFTNIKPFDPKTSFSEVLLQNFATLTAVLCISLYMRMLINNQIDTLKAIESEYSGLMERLKHSFPDQYEQVCDSVSELNRRYNKIQGYLHTSRYSVSITFLIVLFLFLARFDLIKNMILCAVNYYF